MKHIEHTGIILAAIGAGLFLFFLGFQLSLWTQIVPGDKEYTLQTIESNDAEKAQFCVSLMVKPVEKECMPDLRYLPCDAPKMECDCAIDFEAGRVSGWAEAIAAEKMETGRKKTYCEKSYCEPSIVRSIRPTTK